MSLMPRQIGYQDLVALQARQPEALQRARAALASPFGTIHAATFSLPRPVGTLIPEPPSYRLASLVGRRSGSHGCERSRIGRNPISLWSTAGSRAISWWRRRA